MPTTTESPIDILKRHLRRFVDRANLKTGDLVKKLNEDPVNAIRWLQGTPQILLEGRHAQHVIDLLEDQAKTPEEWVSLIIDGLGRKINSWSPQYSTSPFANVVHNDELESMRTILTLLENSIDG